MAYLVGRWALDFDVGTDPFHQNITAFDFQACDVNWIYWNGYNAYVEADELLSLVAPAAGRAEWHADRHRVIAGIAFSADCETLTLSHADNGGIVHTYFGN